jgi:hypothetical protein
MKLNVKQRKVLIAGVVTILVMGLFPPWSSIFDRKASVDAVGFYIDKPTGYSFIMDPPKPDSSVYGMKINFSILILQWFIVSIATGLGIFLLSNKEDKE